ncbi:MAG: hypothetical protein U9O85_06070 [Euryarchaeota archaeon]|nr:hypothetical protein [Euryarchaeota archaeon]
MYHHKLQGFVYELLRDAKFGMLHDKEGYKFFCFSNLFPIKDMEEGEISKLLIASPNEKLIASLEAPLRDFSAGNRRINVGEMSFEVVKFKKLGIKLKSRDLRVITATPIIIRIPERNYELNTD